MGAGPCRLLWMFPRASAPAGLGKVALAKVVPILYRAGPLNNPGAARRNQLPLPCVLLAIQKWPKYVYKYSRVCYFSCFEQDAGNVMDARQKGGPGWCKAARNVH